MTFDVVTLGETMLRLSPLDNLRLEQAAQLDMNFGGSESNLAINLARLGKRVAWYSRAAGKPAWAAVRGVDSQQGVDVSAVTWAQNERMGLYFVEFGQGARGIKVWYDRAGSAASCMTGAELPREMIGAARWFHASGITPALGQNCSETVSAAFELARAQGSTISFDVNYRALLWDAATAAKGLTRFCEAADVVFIALRDAHNLWKMQGDAPTVAKALQSQWGGKVIVTNAADGAAACDGRETVHVPAIATTIVDRLGAGDALASGVICRLLEDASLTEALRFGVAVAALKLTIVGDVAWVSRTEVETLVSNQQKTLER